MDDSMKHLADAVAGSSSIVTILIYWTGILSQIASIMAPILTCIVLSLTALWYVVRLVDRWNGMIADDKD